ncbi:MAG: hypothetical protein K2N88_07500 [Muribaculaceae bacterium]|nr:hypothetical protein [Muribaculaceae bacterium]
MFNFFVGLLCFFGKNKTSQKEIEDIGFFDVIKSLWNKKYDPFNSETPKKKYLTKLKGGRSVGWSFFGLDFLLTGLIIYGIYALDSSFFLDYHCNVMSNFKETGMSLIGILTGANFVTFSILCTAQIFTPDNMDDDRRTVVAEGVAYICIQLLLALFCFILPLLKFPVFVEVIILIFAVIYIILITIDILFHIFALIIYTIHVRNNK